MIKYFFLGFSILLLVLLVFLFFESRNNEATNNESLWISNSEVVILNIHKQNREHELYLNGQSILETSRVLNENNKEENLIDIAKPNTLCLRISEYQCNTCIEAEIENLKKLPSQIKHHNIIILSTSISPKYLRQLKKMYNLDFPCYTLLGDLENQIPDIGAPYYFFLNGREINMLFVPSMDIVELTDKYFRYILMRKYQ